MVGRLRTNVAPDALIARVCEEATALQASRGGLDAVIFCVTPRYLLWWEHAPDAVPAADRFGQVADAVFAGAPRLVRMPPAITAPYAGLTLHPSGDFVCMQFSRLCE